MRNYMMSFDIDIIMKNLSIDLNINYKLIKWQSDNNKTYLLRVCGIF